MIHVKSSVIGIRLRFGVIYFEGGNRYFHSKLIKQMCQSVCRKRSDVDQFWRRACRASDSAVAHEVAKEKYLSTLIGFLPIPSYFPQAFVRRYQ